MSVQSFNTEQCCDYLEVYGGENMTYPLMSILAGRYTLSQPPPLQSCSFYLRFRSDSSAVSEGFTVTFSAEATGNFSCVHYGMSYYNYQFVNKLMPWYPKVYTIRAMEEA